MTPITFVLEHKVFTINPPNKPYFEFLGFDRFSEELSRHYPGPISVRECLLDDVTDPGFLLLGTNRCLDKLLKKLDPSATRVSPRVVWMRTIHDVQSMSVSQPSQLIAGAIPASYFGYWKSGRKDFGQLGGLIGRRAVFERMKIPFSMTQLGASADFPIIHENPFSSLPELLARYLRTYAEQFPAGLQ